MANRFNCLYAFGTFCLDPEQRRLTREGDPVHLPPKVFDLLLVLVERAGRLVDKRELMEAVWSGLFVEEGNVTVAIHTLRRALNSDGSEQKFIETVSKRGYRFCAEVRCIEGEITPSAEPAGGESSEASNPEPVRAPDLGAATELETPAKLSPAKGLTLSFSDEVLRRIKLHPALIAAAVSIPLLLQTITLVSAWRQSPIRHNFGPIRSLAVLPFVIIGDQKRDAYLGVAMADAVTTKLNNVGTVVIRPTSAIERYVGAVRNPISAGREQGVDAVLDGHLQELGDRIRLTVQLICVENGARIWGGTFEAKYTNLFSAQDTMAAEVASSLEMQFTGSKQNRITRRTTESSEAYRAYVKGRYFWNKRTTAGLWKGLKYFQEAVALDPAYAQALTGIADTYALLGEYSVLAPNAAFPVAERYANKALEIDPELAEAHATLGFVKLFYQFDGIAAEEEFRRAIQNNPNYAIAHTWYGVDLAAMGRHKEAITEAKRAEAIDPLSLTVTTDIGLIFYLAGQSDEAIDSIRKAIDIDPTFGRAHFRLGNAYRRKGMNQEAVWEYQKAIQLSRVDAHQEDQHYDAALALAYSTLGNQNESRRILNLLIDRSRHEYVPAYSIALIYSGLGEKEKMFAWLTRAYEQRCSSLAYLKVDPALKNYRSEPQIVTLAKSLRF